VLSPASANAQPWVTAPDESTISVLHHFVQSGIHLNKEGLGTKALGAETFHVVALEGTYGLRERFAIEAGVVWLATKWTGPEHERHGPLDTGSYHATFQDLRVALRYQLTGGEIGIAPFLAITLPTHDYETRGHSAFGRNLRELEAGVSVGRTLANHGYVYGGVSYAWSADVKGVDLDLDHMNGDVEIGHRAGRRVNLRGFSKWQLMWDGLQLGPLTEHLELSPVHDRLARASYVQLGGGAAVDLNNRATLSVDAFVTQAGRNVHAVYAVVTGISWSFGGGFTVIPTRPPS
jgi:hypothetical protein